MAMTEAERKEAKRQAYLRWYAKKHRKPLPQGTTPSAKKKALRPAAKAEAKPAKKAPAKKALRPAKDPNAALQKAVDKLVRRGQKTMAQAKTILKEAAALLGDVYKADDEKFVQKAEATLCRGLLLQVEDQPLQEGGKAKKAVSAAFGARLFALPKKRVPTTVFEKEIAALGIPLPPPEASGGSGGEEPVEVPVDPEIAKKLREDADSGNVPEWQAPDESEAADEDSEETEEAPEEEEEEEDEDDLTDEEKEEREQRRREEDEEADFQGREEALAEVEAMGFGEEDA